MKINWKVRASNPHFWVQVALAIGVPVGAYFGITGADVTSWASLWSIVTGALSNPYVLATVAISVYNTVTDPTTKGIGDSARALRYDEPNDGSWP